MNDKDEINPFKAWADLFHSAIPLWEYWGLISRYQKDIAANYCRMFGGDYFRQKAMQLVPESLTQSINPWSFSLIQFTSELKGSPAREYKIIKEVAGYGSQLGTIMGFLEVFLKEYPLERQKLADEDIYNVQKFKKLVGDIKNTGGE